MNTLFDLLDALAAHGPTVLLGASLVLLAGCVAMRWTSHGAERRRLGVLTGAAAGIYVLVAFVPMQRWQVTFEGADVALAPEPAPELQPPTADTAPLVDAQVRLAALRAQVERVLSAEPVEAADAGHAPSLVAAQTMLVSPTPWPWGRIGAGAYVLAAALLLLRHALGFHRLQRLLRRSQRAPIALHRSLTLPRQARVLIAEHTVRPFCAGWLRPVIVLPRALLEPQRSTQARAVLRHEAAHLRAGDPFVQMLFSLLAIPLGLHPLFWWLVRDVRFQCELLADDAAAAADRTDYARELIDLAETAAPALHALGTVSVFHRPSDFYRRMQMLLQREGRLSASSSRVRRTAQAVAAFLCVGVAASVLGVPLRAQDPTPESALQQQNEKLRAELDALRTELRDLRAALVSTNGTLGRVANDPAADEQLRSALGRIQNLRAALENADGSVGRLISDPDAADPLKAAMRKLQGDGEAADGSGDPVTWEAVSRELKASQAQWEEHRRTVQDNAPPRSYTVQKGDSFRTIARQLLGSADRVDELMAANPGCDPTRLRVGQTLTLPASSAVVSADTPGLLDTLDRAKKEQSGRDVENIAKQLKAALDRRKAEATSPAEKVVAEEPPGASGPAEQEPPPVTYFVSGPDGLPSQRVSPPKADRTAPSATAEATADLASRYLDLQGELEVAELTASEVESMAKAGRAMLSEAKRATSKRDTLQKKLAIVRRLIDGEIQASESELKWLERKLKEGDKTERLQIDAQIQRAQVRLEVLRSVK
jgi:beta-lactamase regulating signal transducer with metallopeptidase domain/LysM repeat protein